MKSKKKKLKLNFKFVFVLLIIIIAIVMIIKVVNKKGNTQIENNQNNMQVSNNEDSQNEVISEDSIEYKIAEMEKINQERRTKSEITTKRNIPVLMYHFFYDEQAGETGADNNFMEIHDFEEQIKYLADNDYYVPSWEELEDFANGKIGLPEKSVIITVDDGSPTFFNLAVPVLEKYKFYATSFYVTSWYPEILENFESSVVDFQSHSNNMHRPGTDGKGAILTLSDEEICNDLETCKKELGENCKIFCYPFGHYNDRSKKILNECGYTMAFTVKGGYVSPGMNLYELPRIRMSKNDTLQSFINRIK